MRLAFGDCVFDSDTREVLRGGRPLPISPKAFALLGLLVESRPRAVSNAEIRAHLWPDTHVTSASLGNLVVRLRAALGDDARRPRIIRTVARFGYAFSAAASPARTSGGGEPESHRRLYRLIWGRREIALEPGENLIGRDLDAVVWIDDDSVSRRHASISVGEDGASIADLGSKNGTSVGDRKIRGPLLLKHRDVVRVGPATLRVRVVKRAGSTRSVTRGRSRT